MTPNDDFIKGLEYYIKKNSLNTPLQIGSGKTIKHIEIDYDGQVKEFEW